MIVVNLLVTLPGTLLRVSRTCVACLLSASLNCKLATTTEITQAAATRSGMKNPTIFN